MSGWQVRVRQLALGQRSVNWVVLASNTLTPPGWVLAV